MEKTLSGKGVVGLCVLSIGLTVLSGISERRRLPLRSIVYWSNGYVLDSVPECSYPFLGSAHFEDPEALRWWSPERRSAQAASTRLQKAKEETEKLRQYSEMASEKAKGQKVSPRLQAKHQLARQLLMLGDPEGALKLYEELSRKGGGIYIEISMADSLIRLGRTEEALDILNTLSIRLETAPMPLLMMAPLYLRLGEEEIGEKLFRKVMRLEPRTQTAQLEFARYLASTGRLEEARKFYELYLSIPLQAQSLRPHLELASLLEKLGDVQGAVKKLRMLSKAQPRSKTIQIHLASLLLELEQYDEAAAATKNILGTDPFDERALQLMAVVFLAQGEHEKSKQYLEYLLGNDQQNPTALALRGDIAYDQNNEKEAEAFYRRALSISPSLHGVCNNLAWLLLHSDRLDEAKDYAMQATAFSPKNAAYYDTLATILEGLGDQEGAEAAAEKSKELLDLDSSKTKK